ncbi:lactococcin 972 family bacteriocin [Heyndrickxia faecalis]|uniref:lactococcin 972 family bacteriocin n=1 Tax=Heyndrickxia TaxID=2837504 RepID=UPI002DB58F02|nr:lactococcin 972 family bacteriocin [Weizmannia sp. CD-2023]MEC2224469.1 lactococcin 972 family bacteriocin [Weizmannia sp. CD-2023]MED4867507.1 lactococcin 972 family bacteriocin [Weizmannia sp. CD-2023]
MKKIGTVVGGALILMMAAVPVFAQTDSPEKGGTVELKGESTVTPYTIKTVDGGHGRWDYGTTLTLKLKKKVWSNLDHDTKTHRSSTEIDGNYDNSGWVAKRTTSRASSIGARNSVGYANWDVK